LSNQPLKNKGKVEQEILEKLEEMPPPEILAQITMGPYPPPDMMAEYKKSCPEVYEQIVEGVKTQRQHRISQEEKQVNQKINTLSNSERTQAYLSYIALCGSLIIIIGQLWHYGEVKHWIIPAILAVVAIGGKPVATIVAQFISKTEKVVPRTKQSKSEDE
jgi:uncharacterized membrane protein